ncbi:hypothetical protein G7Y89_g12421 [Cudoniella acicularis]|uniref:mannan endo-1,6-alpha-mannosidase n=1 Tax=Cudoniella acicularis TaxID=354080 RepID=A0A8H4R8V6_9HELO|nr:hypothetical protein G7Y89_g12421 [Cudoniella acicularis]
MRREPIGRNKLDTRRHAQFQIAHYLDIDQSATQLAHQRARPCQHSPPATPPPPPSINSHGHHLDILLSPVVTFTHRRPCAPEPADKEVSNLHSLPSRCSTLLWRTHQRVLGHRRHHLPATDHEHQSSLFINMHSSFLSRAATALLLGCNLVSAIDLDIDSADSIKNAAATIAYDMMSYYKGNTSGGIIGVLPGPPPDPTWGYYWWESGAMWGTMIDYWHYTNDTSYNDVVYAGVQWQVGENDDMMPSNWSQSMGNDDQAFWGMTAMLAAEYNFQNPPPTAPQWLALAQAVFNTQAVRPDTTCGGGLRWQVYPYLTGYDYKNSIANGCFFNLGARLARYTNNQTYADYAEKTWTWITGVGLMDADYNIYDGAHIEDNCTDINKVQFSYNMAVWLLGAANMYNYTNGSAIWQERTTGLLNTTLNLFFPNDIAYEVACETKLTCTTDMYSFKAYLTRWLASTTKMAPFTYDLIMPRLRASAIAAAAQCVGGSNGRTCGLSWSKAPAWDGTYGVGQQMAAMSAIFVNLLPLENVAPPVTNVTGGTSVGNSNAGSQSVANPEALLPVASKDKVGAGILTTVVLLGATGMFGWMSL